MMQSESDNNKIPVLFTNKNQCCGCSACVNICPVEAIRMQFDDEGFLYPEIIREKCIKCFSCERVCVFKKHQAEKWPIQ